MRLALELALEPELARVQALTLQVAEMARLEPQVQVQTLAQVQLELEQHLRWSHPKPQLHRHRCKAPDRSQEPQLELRQTHVHPRALDMTPRVLALSLEPQVRQELELELV